MEFGWWETKSGVSTKRLTKRKLLYIQLASPHLASRWGNFSTASSRIGVCAPHLGRYFRWLCIHSWVSKRASERGSVCMGNISPSVIANANAPAMLISGMEFSWLFPSWIIEIAYAYVVHVNCISVLMFVCVRRCFICVWIEIVCESRTFALIINICLPRARRHFLSDATVYASIGVYKAYKWMGNEFSHLFYHTEQQQTSIDCTIENASALKRKAKNAICSVNVYTFATLCEFYTRNGNEAICIYFMFASRMHQRTHSVLLATW